MSQNKKNIFVLGMNDFNKQKLNSLSEANECDFHTLLTYEESHGSAEYRVDELMEKAVNGVESFDGSIDGFLGFWDFPISIMHAILCKKYGARGPSPQSVLLCENKLWSRIKQHEVAPDLVPNFAGFDPFADDPRRQIDLDYPFWIKPIKSFAGHLGFRIENDADFERAIGKMQRRIHRFIKPLQRLYEYINIPKEFDQNDPRIAIAEKIIDGKQCTAEGWVFNGEYGIHGIIDSNRFPNSSVFSHYQYPSSLHHKLDKRLAEASKNVMQHIQFDNWSYNIEYLWDEDNDTLSLLEINPRISQSHADLFDKVDGASNHKIPVSIALGRKPGLPSQQGEYKVAGRFFVRRFENGIVESAPGDRELAQLKKEIPDVIYEILAEEGQELEELEYQDSYSYKLAILYLGGETEDELLRKFKRAKQILGFEVEELEQADT